MPISGPHNHGGGASDVCMYTPVISGRRIVRRLKIRPRAVDREKKHSWFGGNALRMSWIPPTDDAGDQRARNLARSCPPSVFYTRSTQRSADLCFLRVFVSVLKCDTSPLVKAMYIRRGIKLPKNETKIDFGQEGLESSIGGIRLSEKSPQHVPYPRPATRKRVPRVPRRASIRQIGREVSE